MTYRVKLEVFEGPLDLLLYLIKKENLSISDIPISRITEQYLQYLEMMSLLDLNIAGEFLVMAATLMHIKSKMLLPKIEEELSGDEEDPRAELVKKLLEYQKFKEVASCLSQKENEQKYVFKRLPSDVNKPQDDSGYFEANLFDLITAFTKVLKEIPKKAFYEVIKDEFTVAEKIHDVYHMLVKKSVIYFSELFDGAKSKLEVITIFLALLELIRLKEVNVYQSSHFEEIKVTRNEQNISPVNQ